MTPPPPALRCATESLARQEPVAGTASHVRTWLLLEHAGPWGSDALRDARLPEGLGADLKRLARQHRAKVVLIRRHNSRAAAEGSPRVFAAYSDPLRPRLESGLVADPRELLDLDLAALRSGGTTGLAPYDGTLFCVCTNGRHDACCAERGRPIAAALAATHPDETWEISHIGGDRFAGNLVVLPHGFYYGHLEASSAVEVADAQLAGELELDHLRGRSGHPMAVQAAEIHLRRLLGVTGLDAVELTGHGVDGRETRADLRVGGTTYRVLVRTTPGEPAQLTCKAGRPNRPPVHQVLGVDALG